MGMGGGDFPNVPQGSPIFPKNPYGYPAGPSLAPP